MLADYVIDCSFPSATQAVSAPLKENLRGVFVSIFDQVIQELDSRCNERSVLFVHSLLVLNPNDDKFFKSGTSQRVCFVGPTKAIPNDLKHELPVVKPFIRNKLMSTVTLVDGNHGIMQVHDVQESLYQYKEAFPQTYKLFCVAATFGASSATCENSFSTLTRILTPARRSTLQDEQSGDAVIRERINS